MTEERFKSSIKRHMTRGLSREDAAAAAEKEASLEVAFYKEASSTEELVKFLSDPKAFVKDSTPREET